MPMFVNLPSEHSSIPFPTLPFSPTPPSLYTHNNVHSHFLPLGVNCFARLCQVSVMFVCFCQVFHTLVIHTHTHAHIHTRVYILATLAPTQVPPLTRLPRLSSAKLSICSTLKCGKNFHTKRYSIYQIYIPFIIIVCSMFFYMFPRLMFIAFYDVDRIIFWHILA